MRKTIKKTALLKKTGRVSKLPAQTKASKSRELNPLQKIRAEKHILKTKLKELKAEFKQKLQNTFATAYEKAKRDFENDFMKRTEAKQKALAAAEAKFEKKFTAKSAKKNHTSVGKRGRPASIKQTAPQHHAMTSQTQKRGRGRPRKFA